MGNCTARNAEIFTLAKRDVQLSRSLTSDRHFFILERQLTMFFAKYSSKFRRGGELSYAILIRRGNVARITSGNLAKCVQFALAGIGGSEDLEDPPFPRPPPSDNAQQMCVFSGRTDRMPF